MGTGEALPHLAPLHCPPARVFAHHCIARMCALQSHALFALPSCVIAALMLCVCVVRRRSMWCNGACKAAGWACGVQLERGGVGREVSLHVCASMCLMRTIKLNDVLLLPCVPCDRLLSECIRRVFFENAIKSKSANFTVVAICIFVYDIYEETIQF